MKKIAALIIAVFITGNVLCQEMPPDIKQLLDSTIYYTKQTSLYSKNVNWDTLQQKMFHLAKDAKTVNELRPALSYLLNSLNDYHGKYLNPTTYVPFAWFTDWDRLNKTAADKREKSRKVMNILKDSALKFSYQLINKDIGYIKIIGISASTNVESESKKIRNAVIDLTKKKATKWIIDLRFNEGGNMNPMMAGIAPLVGNGFVGFLSNSNNDTLGKWEIKNNNFIWDDYQAVELNNKPTFKKSPKIAVLISRYTVSSGEFVATTLKGRPSTRFFGEASGGYTTSTNWITIGNQLIISVSSGFYCDRNGTMYTLNIPVDEEVVFDPEKQLKNDDGILSATKWLNKK